MKLGRILGWLALWGFWIVASRDNHPNLKLNVIASSLLVMTFAAAVYINRRLRRRYQAFPYAIALLFALTVLSFVCTAAIHVVYDRLWGPNPARFGFWTNFGMEFTLTTLHVALIAGSARLLTKAKPDAVR